MNLYRNENAITRHKNAIKIYWRNKITKKFSTLCWNFCYFASGCLFFSFWL